MRFQLNSIKLSVLFVFFFIGTSAADRDSLIKKENKIQFRNANSKFSRTIYTAKERQFENLDQYLEERVFSVNESGGGFNDEYFDQFNNAIDTGIQAWRVKAANAANEVEQTNAFVDYLQPSDIYKLPVGFKKKLGNGSELTIAVSSAVFNPAYAELTVFAKLKIAQSSSPLFFGIEGLKLSYSGGIIGSAKLILLGDVAIPIQGNNAALILRGSGFSTASGTASSPEKTYIGLDCNGFQELGLTADVEFPRSLIVPVNTAGNPLSTGKVTANITNLKIANWNDIIASLNFTTPFQVNGLNGFVFTVHTAAFDFSDFRNNPDIVYPAGYQDKYLQKDALDTWRGVYIKELDLALPKSFKNRTDTNALVSFGVKDLIIDNNGLTGVFYGNNILPINKGNAAGWKFSVDSLRIALEASRLVRAGFGGKIGLPVNKTAADGSDSADKRKYFEYSAAISFGGDYVCKVVTKDSIDFDVFTAKVLLLPNSYIQLKGSSDRFEAEAMLNGKIGILSNKMNENDANSGRPAIADMKGIEFQELRIASTAPHFSAKYFGYQGELKFGNFPVSFENISLITPSAEEVGIAFAVNINLGDEKGESSSFKGTAGLRVLGKTNRESGGILNWQFEKIVIDSVRVDADVKNAFHLDGWVHFFDNTDPSSPRYGRGFDGGINATFKGLKPTIRARVMFAKAPTFRYWYVDGKLDWGAGVGVAPFRVRGFAGGAYYGVKKVGYSSAFQDGSTGIEYAADSTAGLGVKAALLFDIGTKAASGEASFEMAFNKGGGLRYIGFFGMIKLSYDVLPEGIGIGDYLTKQLKKVDALTNSGNNGIDLVKLKETNPTEAAKYQKEHSENDADPGDKDPPNSKPGDEGLSAYIGIQYDFNKSTLHANFELYINAAAGLLTGSGDGNRAGWAVFHSEPNSWYLHVGTPSNPVGVKFGIGSLRIKTSAYLMLGYDMPPFPAPPYQVTSILSQSGLNYTSNMGQDEVQSARGIAFGAGVNVSTGDLRFLIFYANFSAGIGFDVMLSDYGKNAHCEGSNNTIGINGWYAQGQAYAYLQGELGIKVKLFFIKKKIAIIKGGAAALFQARLPNPTWVGGALGFHFSILGGLIHGSAAFKFSFGDDCKIVGANDVSEEEVKIISEIKPDSNANDVSVLAKPSIRFRAKPGQIMEIPKEDGSGNELYRPSLDVFKLYKGQTEVAGKASYNSDGDVITMIPNAVLDGSTEYKLFAKVSFQKFVNGHWVTYVENGQRVEEVQQYNFTTGVAPDTLSAEIIERLYPFFDQRNLYKGEVNKGIVLLNQTWTQFFTKYPSWKVSIEAQNGTVVDTSVATTDGVSKFEFVMPSGLQVNTTYNFLIMGNGAARPALKYKFTTSKFNTLADKINSLHSTQPVVGRVSSDAIDLEATVNDYEGFDLYELIGNNYTGNQPTIIAEADTLDDVYYKQYIRPLMYSSSSLTSTVTNPPLSFSISNPSSLIYGNPPLRAIVPSWYYINSLQTKTFNNLIKTRLPFAYDLGKYYSLHFADYRLQLIGAFVDESGPNGLGGIPSNLEDNLVRIISRGMPFMLKGYYKTKFTYRSYDGTNGTTGEFIYENPIE